MSYISTLIKRGCLVAALFLCACSPDEKSNERFKRISKGLKQHELKRLSESQIISATYEQGKQITQASQKEWIKSLEKALKSGGVSHAISFCNLDALPAIDSLSRKYSVKIRRTALKTSNTKNQPDDLEKQLLDAYHYTWEQGGEIKQNVQDMENGYLLYTKPIMLDRDMCLNCHGEIGESLSNETYAMIKKMYPDYKATGYNKNDLKGMWSVLLSKKQVIRSIPAED